jgi:hypothetical protein
MNWFINPFMGSKVPIAYEKAIEMTDEFTGYTVRGIEREIVGYVMVDDLPKFMHDMKKIQDEVRV